MLTDSEIEKLKKGIHDLLLKTHIISNNILSVEELRYKLSKAITSFAFRNGPIEGMHADPTKNITDEDMMILNKYMVDHIEIILESLSENNFTDMFIFSTISDLYCSQWDKPNPDKYRDDFNYCLKLALLLGIPIFFKKKSNNDNS